jgi:hypothetical protein
MEHNNIWRNTCLDQDNYSKTIVAVADGKS